MRRPGEYCDLRCHPRWRRGQPVRVWGVTYDEPPELTFGDSEPEFNEIALAFHPRSIPSARYEHTARSEKDIGCILRQSLSASV